MRTVSVVVPVRDNAAQLAECLSALAGSRGVRHDVIVVDDASRDDGAGVAARHGARVVRLDRNAGASAARNAGVRHATGDVVVFVDSDVVVAPDTLARLVAVLDAEPEVAAVFGSYDAAPRAPGLVSQYRNLLHHFVHQESTRDASTFWSGCGAIRRRAFEHAGGFDDATRGIEDIELGYRLRAAGERIVLARDVQVTHLKRWTLASVVRTDTLLRALPWSRLLLARGSALDHLNVGASQRLSVALAVLATALVPLAPVARPLALAGGVAGLGLVWLNRRLLAFFGRERGPLFAVATLPLLWLHYLSSGLCWAWAFVEHRLGGGAHAARRKTA